MEILDIIQKTGAIDAISRELGMDAATARSGAAALLPAILGGFKKQDQSTTGGLGGLIDILSTVGGGSLLDAVTSKVPTPSAPGNEILGQIFGSKDVSRTVAGQAAQTTGIDSGLLKKMLPILAMAVTGYFANQKSASASASGGIGGILGQVLGGVLGGKKANAAPAGGLGSLVSLLDFDGDGNPLDDIIGMAARLGR